MNSRLLEVVSLLWRNGRARGALFIIIALLVLHYFPANVGKMLGAGLVLFLAVGLYREWKEYLRPVRTLYVIHGIRARRFVKRLARIPPDVPFLYGIALMLSLAGTVLGAFMKPTESAMSFMIATEWIIGLGAFRHGLVAIRTIAKLTWSGTLGKLLYASLFSVALWLGRSDAAAAVRQLTHADAKYFPIFVGVMSGPYSIFRMLQFGSALISVCAVLLLFASWPRIIGRMLRTGLSRQRLSQGNDEHRRRNVLPDAISLLTPVGLLLVASQLLELPQLGIAALQKFSAPALVLARTEYVDDRACKNIPTGVLTQHLGDKQVSVLTIENGTPVFSQSACDQPS
ncbi:hypothetical protein J2777_004714 [Paraburkholderia graminis]|uniref:hypothetical protein n=1 Tax=Paraburkholderia graminis TaxID=60548 RepID=UPI002866245B|nr:hypothetical protein [Paraburkholderia graminis]MDR6470974.1 hypothetical protein [Paraburkholderia graminis]